METSGDKYIAWWYKGNEQLSKFADGRCVKSFIELMFTDFYISDIPCPDLTVSDEEVIMDWPVQNKKAVVSSDENGEFIMILPELVSGPYIPLLPTQIKEFQQWFNNQSSQPIEGGDVICEEGIPPTQDPPLRKASNPKSSKGSHDPSDKIMDMMSSMLKTFNLDDMFDKMDEEPSSPTRPPPVPMDVMGQCITLCFLSFLRMLTWMVTRVSVRVHLRCAIKGLIIETMKDVQDGYWNDILSSPDRTLYKVSPNLHRIFDFIFQGVNFSIRHRTVMMALLMLSGGYRFGTVYTV